MERAVNVVGCCGEARRTRPDHTGDTPPLGGSGRLQFLPASRSSL